MFSFLKILSRKGTITNSSLVIKNLNQKLCFSFQNGRVKICILGASGAVGQPLALLLKQSPFVDHLSLYDNMGTSGFGKELEYIDTVATVSSTKGEEHIGEALVNSSIVVVCAAKKKSADSSSDGFDENAKIVATLCENIGKYAPRASVVIVTNPVNSLLPLAYHVLSHYGFECSTRLFGLATVYNIRANTFIAQATGLEPECVKTPVVGGVSDNTVVPVLSASSPYNQFTNEELEKINTKVRKAAQENKSVGASPALSCAFAASRFVLSLVKASLGKPNILGCAFVKSDVCPMVEFLASPLHLGYSGILRNLGLPELTEYESCLLDKALPILREDIKKGTAFVNAFHKEKQKKKEQN